MTLTEAFEAFPNIEKVLILRTDMTRLGVEFTRAARDELNKRDDFQSKGLDIFSQAMGKPATLADKIPLNATLDDGTERGTGLIVRTGGETPYAIDFIDGEFWATWNGKRVTKVIGWAQKCAWSNLKLPDGTPVFAVIQGSGKPD